MACNVWRGRNKDGELLPEFITLMFWWFNNPLFLDEHSLGMIVNRDNVPPDAGQKLGHYNEYASTSSVVF